MKWDNKFVGQAKVKNVLEIFVVPQIKEKGYCDNILFEGESGTGKTTIAKLLTVNKCKIIMAPAIKTKADIMSILTNLVENDFIFIDEIHRLDSEIEELLYQAIDDKKLTITIGKIGDNHLVELDLPNFTLIGATTLSGLISKPLKDRFPLRIKMDSYTNNEIKEIVRINLDDVDICDQSLELLAKNCKGTPRIAKNMANRVMDYARYLQTKFIKISEMNEMISIMGLKNGLNQNDIKYLRTIKQNNGYMGLMSLSKNMQMNIVNLTSDIEPYLLSNNYIKITGRGREITEKGLKLLG